MTPTTPQSASDPRWTEETVELAARALAVSRFQLVQNNLFVGSTWDNSPARTLLAALADAGVLLPPGGETREEWIGAERDAMRLEADALRGNWVTAQDAYERALPVVEAAQDLVEAEAQLTEADSDSGEWKAAEQERDRAWDRLLDTTNRHLADELGLFGPEAEAVNRELAQRDAEIKALRAEVEKLRAPRRTETRGVECWEPHPENALHRCIHPDGHTVHYDGDARVWLSPAATMRPIVEAVVDAVPAVLAALQELHFAFTRQGGKTAVYDAYSTLLDAWTALEACRAGGRVHPLQASGRRQPSQEAVALLGEAEDNDT